MLDFFKSYKMKYKITIVLAASLFCLTHTILGQNRLIRKAEKQYSAQAYHDAINTYRMLLSKGDSSQTVISNLANSYLKISDYEKAAKWYEKIWKTSRETAPLEYAYKYALCLKSTGNYTQSDSIMEWLAEKQVNKDNRISKFMDNKDYRYWIDSENDDFEVIRLSQNSSGVDFAPSLTENELVFSSDRNQDTTKKKRGKQRKGHPLRLFSFNSSKGETPQLFSDNIDSGFNESSTTFSKNHQYIYVTRNNNTGKKLKKDNQGFSRLKLYRAIKEGDIWGSFEELPFNSDNYSTAHPSITEDGSLLYFASDRPGGYGGTDIYFISLLEDGKLSNPVNMGPNVNTEGDETFPYIGSDGVLFFSSDGHPGLGGMDIFAIDTRIDGSNCVINLGCNVNSRFDDLGIVFNEDYSRGYLSSDRKRETKMDIYSIKKIANDAFTVRCHADVKVKTINASTNVSESNVTVSLLDKKGNILHTNKTDSKGVIETPLRIKKGEYSVMASKEGYKDKNQKFILKKNNGKVRVEIALEMINSLEAKDFQYMLEQLQLPAILFAFDSSALTKNAKVVLKEIAKFMKNNDTTHLLIYGHTDILGPQNYNLILSKSRADSVRHFLIQQGISEERLKTKGMGESQPQDCGKINCTHYKNRRVEYKINN